MKSEEPDSFVKMWCEKFHRDDHRVFIVDDSTVRIENLDRFIY